MDSFPPVFLSRSSRAFSSLAVTVALAVLTILALAIGSMRDSKAETNAGLLSTLKVEDPAIEWNGFARSQSLPDRQASEAKPQMISRQPLSVASQMSRMRASGPTQEWMGFSKLAFPLLIGDLVAGRSVETPLVMTGKMVGSK